MAKFYTILKKIGSVFGWVLSITFFLVVALILLLRVPAIQQLVTDKATDFLSEKLETTVAIKRLFVTFRGDIELAEVFLAEQNGDTIAWIGRLEAGVSFYQLYKGNIHVSRFEMDDALINITRLGPEGIFNFDFITEAFGTEQDPQAPEVEKTETDTTAMDFALGPVRLKQIQFQYNDEAVGVNVAGTIGDFILKTKLLDIAQLQFELEEFQLEHSTFEVILQTPLAPDTTTTESGVPWLSADYISLTEVDVMYLNKMDSSNIAAEVGNFALANSSLDLAENAIISEKIELSESNIRLFFPETTSPPVTTEENTTFSWPEWNINIANVAFENNQFSYKVKEEKSSAPSFDPDDINLTIETIQLRDISYVPELANIRVEEIKLTEAKGLAVDEMGFVLSLDSTHIDVSKLGLVTSWANLAGDFSINFMNFDTFITSPENASYRGNIIQGRLFTDKIIKSYPSLDTLPYASVIAKHPLIFSLDIDYSEGAVDARKATVRWGTAKLSTKGTASGLTTDDAMYIDVPDFQFQVEKRDVLPFLAETDSLPIPEKISLNGRYTGNPQNGETDMLLATDFGNLHLVGNYQTDAEVLSYEIDLLAKQLNLLEITGNEALGDLFTHISIEGSGTTLHDLQANFTFTIDSVSYQNYRYEDIVFEGVFEQNELQWESKIDQPHLAWLIEGTAMIDSLGIVSETKIDLRQAALQTLGFTSDNVNAAFVSTINFENTDTLTTADIIISNAIFQRDKEIIRMREVAVSARLQPDLSLVEINSGFLVAKMATNTRPEILMDALSHYLDPTVLQDTIASNLPPTNLQVDIKVFESSYLKEILLPGLARMDTISIEVNFDSQTQLLISEITAPYTQYGPITIEEFYTEINGGGDSIDFQVGFGHLIAGPINIFNTRLAGDFLYPSVNAMLSIEDKAQADILMANFGLDMGTDTLRFRLEHENLVLNYAPWDIPADNELLIVGNRLLAENWNLSSGRQLVKIENQIIDEHEAVWVHFEDFELQTFTSFLSASDAPLSGIMDGDIYLQNIRDRLLLTANTKIEELTALNELLGTMEMVTKNEVAGQYDMSLTLNGPRINTSLTGKYSASESETTLDIDLDIENIQMTLIQAFSLENINNSSGYIAGNLHLNGTTAEPKFSGNLSFPKTNFTVAYLNAPFSLSEQQIKFDQSGINFNEFTLLDERNNRTTISGAINTASYINPIFDLKILTRDFQLLNSTQEDNDLFFGKMIVDIDAQIKGNAVLPRIDLNARLKKGSNITYVVPESELDIIERDNVVRFFNAMDTTLFYNESQNNDAQGEITGIVLKSVIGVDKETSFKIILDERTGDHIVFGGEANLNFNINPSGMMEMTGNYTLSGGAYELSFYEIVQRRFEIVPGSQIIWSGNPMEATLDLQALYKVRANAGDLMADQLSGADAGTRASFRQDLPFEVFIVIKGEMTQPEISFRLDMPQSQRGMLGGNVYTRITQLNANEAELNKQVFSLIVFNQFLPPALSGYESNSPSMARSSVNQLLSNQLNNLSQRYVKGVELDFNLNSLASAEGGESTQLSVSVRKTLYDDRIILQVGSQVGVEGNRNNNDIMGDFSIEYLLTENGRYRLKGFRKNIFEDVVEGQVIITGLSILFNREFNEFNELFAGEKEQPEK